MSTIRKRHPIPRLHDDQISYYDLPGFLPPGHRFAWNNRLGLLSQLAPDQDGRPQIVVQEQFTVQEARVLLPFLDNAPDYCPYEVLFASFYGSTLTEQAIERARTRLLEAMEAGVFDYEMRPLRNVVSRTRLKLQVFGLDARSLLETGYLLTTGEPDESVSAQHKGAHAHA